MTGKRLTKKKRLPDRAAHAEERSAYNPTDEEAESLIKKYGFQNSFRLASALHVAYMAYESRDYIRRHHITNTELKASLKLISERSAAMYEILDKLAPQALHRLHDQGFNFDAVEGMKKSALRLRWAAHYGAKRVTGRSKKNTEVAQRYSFVLHLADAWKDGTGKEPREGTAEQQVPRSGSFRAFVEECARIGNVTLVTSGSSYAVVHDALDWWRTHERKR